MPSIGSTRSSPSSERRTPGRLRNDLDLAADLSAHLHVYAQGRFIDEPLVWAEQLLGLLAVDHPCRPVLLASAATRAIRRGDIADARRLASEAVALAGDTAAALPALDALTDAGLFDGLLEESSATARTMEQLARRYDDRHYLAIAYSGQALSAAYGGPPMSDVETKLAGLTDGALSPSGRGWIEYTHGELCQAARPAPCSRPLRRRRRPPRVPSTTVTSKGRRSSRLARCALASVTPARRSTPSPRPSITGSGLPAPPSS